MYTRAGRFASDEVLKGWAEKLDAALAKGYEGLRLSSNTCWLEQADWEDFCKCEKAVDNVIGRRRMMAMCTYSLQKLGASEIIDVVANHASPLIKRQGRWEIIESSVRKQAEETLKKEALKYAKVLQTAHAGFWIVDMEGKLLEVNDTYCLMSGYSREELLDMRITDIEAKETPEEVRENTSVTCTNTASTSSRSGIAVGTGRSSMPRSGPPTWTSRAAGRSSSLGTSRSSRQWTSLSVGNAISARPCSIPPESS